MKAIKKFTVLGTAALMTAFMGSAYADEGDMTQTRDQTRDQDRVRVEENLQTPTSDFGQARNREQKAEETMEQSKNQYQYQYRHRNNFQTQQPYSGGNNMAGQDGSARGKR